jgi:hypothetical protein
MLNASIGAADAGTASAAEAWAAVATAGAMFVLNMMLPPWGMGGGVTGDDPATAGAVGRKQSWRVGAQVTMSTTATTTP